MSDLVEFLRARLAEDEQTARGACPGPWVVRDWGEPAHFAVFSQRDSRGGAEHVADTELHAIKWRQNRDHIARHDPARVLREVAAKRRTLAEHALTQTNAIGPDMRRVKIDVCKTCGNKHGVPCTTVRLLALPYADHPDYDESWRP